LPTKLHATWIFWPAPPADASLGEAPDANGLFVPDTGETLAPREVEVLRLIAAGASNPQIAERLVVSIHTVKTHDTHILAKLNVATRAAAMLRAHALGIV
jgi:LuxR family maltose regulon positive regulatory protein